MRNDFRRLFLACVAAFCFVTGGPEKAHASHIFYTAPTINGIAVDTFTGGNANPTIVSGTGIFDFEFDIYGSANTFTTTFDPGANVPTGDAFIYDGSGTFGTPVHYTFTRVLLPGTTYIGGYTPNHLDSFPDYRAPNGGEFSEPHFTFTLDAPVSPVPEPSSLALCGIGIAGFAARTIRRRRNRSPAA